MTIHVDPAAGVLRPYLPSRTALLAAVYLAAQPDPTDEERAHFEPILEAAKAVGIELPSYDAARDFICADRIMVG